jgi:hypothetical protein
MKELKEANSLFTSTADKVYNFNTNRKLNLLNIKSLKRTGQLKEGELYDFDYDNQIIACEK